MLLKMLRFGYFDIVRVTCFGQFCSICKISRKHNSVGVLEVGIFLIQ